MTKALFPGSFDPFTIGHDSVVKRALKVYDGIVIAVGVNAEKKCMFTAEERVEAIRRIYAGDPRVKVVTYDGFTCDLAKKEGCVSVIKGIRSVKDYEYERDLADANLKVGGVDTVLIVADPDLSWISSSLLREMKNGGMDISKWIPAPQNK